MKLPALALWGKICDREIPPHVLRSVRFAAGWEMKASVTIADPPPEGWDPPAWRKRQKHEAARFMGNARAALFGWTIGTNDERPDVAVERYEQRLRSVWEKAKTLPKKGAKS